MNLENMDYSPEFSFCNYLAHCCNICKIDDIMPLCLYVIISPESIFVVFVTEITNKTIKGISFENDIPLQNQWHEVDLAKENISLILDVDKVYEST